MKTVPRTETTPPGEPRSHSDSDVGPIDSRSLFAVRRARRAQERWAATPLRRRLEVVRRARHRIADGAAGLARTVRIPQRSSLAETLSAEVLPLAEACRFLEREAAAILRPRRYPGRWRPLWLRGTRTEIRRRPLGVVLIVGPANYPLFLPGAQALQALVAGNAVVVKPGRGGRGAAEALAAVLADAGLPEDLFTVLDETVTSAEAAIRAGVDKVLLTGSAETGRAVLGRLAPELVPATMELSGCDAAFVRADAELELTVAALRFGLLLNGGATCIAPRRVFVHRRLAAELEARLVAELGSAPELPLTPGQEERMAALIDDALARGARLACGRAPREGLASPVVLAGADPDPGAALFDADVFAPILALVPVAGDDEAVELAGRSRFRLGATVFGAPAGAHALALRIDAGVVVINDMIVPTADPRVPFGGGGDSGFGVTRGAEGLLELTRPHTVVLRRGRRRPHLAPPSEIAPRNLGKLLIHYLRAAHAGGVRRRLAAFYRLLRAAARPGGRRSGRPEKTTEIPS